MRSGSGHRILPSGCKVYTMAKEEQKKDLGTLGNSWLDKVKNIRTVANNKQETDPDYSQEPMSMENSEELPPDNELFTGQVYEKLTAQQVFTGNEDFYKSLENYRTNEPIKSTYTGQIPATSNHYKSFSSIQKGLAAAIVLITVMLVYAMLKSPSAPIADLPTDKSETPARQIPKQGPQTANAAQEIPKQRPQTANAAQETPEQIQKPETKLDPTQSFSLKVAQNFYRNRQYDQALLVYEKLHKLLPESREEDLTRDFLQLQMAFCMERTADYTQAGRLLRDIAKSDSLVVKIVANYHRSLLEMRNKQYLNARTYAYQTIAMIDAVDLDREWALSLKRDCHFLIAEAVTRKTLSFYDADYDLPESLWSNFGAADEPFINIDEVQLRTFLYSGSLKLSRAVIGPQIKQFDQQDGSIRYDITCDGAPLEELLARFAANSGIDLHWDLGSQEIGIRKRQINMYLTAAKSQPFAIAAGCAGLLAKMDEHNTVTILNPETYSHVTEHRTIICEEAILLWQKCLLRFPEDERIAKVHFHMGLLYDLKGKTAESIAEYKLVANRFSRSPLAPYALLNASKLKNGLHDYDGGRLDLKQLVEQYPDAQIVGKALLNLADSTNRAGMQKEAIRLYRKAYNLSFSPESQANAALEAGKCSYNTGDYEEAVKWMTRHIEIGKDPGNKNLYSAYLILGKSCLALKNTETACEAFRYAIQGGPAKLAGEEEYIAAISALVNTYMQQGNFVQALEIFEDIHLVGLSEKQSNKILLLKSNLLRAMGLSDNAIAILVNKENYTSDSQFKTEIGLELAECYIEKGDLKLAKKKLGEILVLAEPGPLMHKIAIRLAEVCLQLEENDQALFVCSQLLDLQPPEQTKKNTLDLMAKAYNKQKDYDKAALALLGQWK